MSNLITKFNNGNGTVLCNLCDIMLVDACNVLTQIDCAHVCDKCWQKVVSSLALDELAEQTQEWEKECCEGGPMTAGCFHDRCTYPISQQEPIVTRAYGERDITKV